MKICSIDGCEGKYYALGLCEKHWRRVKKHGTPDDNSRTHGSLEERFWRKVVKGEPGECWKWIGKKGAGYGQVQRGGKGSPLVFAHRLSYELHKGEIPEGLFVLHECDNRECTNPDHLRVGTQSDNIRDAVKRGRWHAIPPKHGGASHPNAISAETAAAIAVAAGTQTELSRRFGVARGVVKAIKTGTHWSCKV